MFPSAFSGEHPPDQEVSWHRLTGMVRTRERMVVLQVVNADDGVLDTDGSNLAFGDYTNPGKQSPLVR
jgi:hypothetical protein